MRNNFEQIDLSDKRKVYVVGDIHGCFELLDSELRYVDFDKKQDMLVSVGDLVDRGPRSDLAVKYAVEPWFIFVRGNHEDMAQHAMTYGRQLHQHNGGSWFYDLPSDDDRRETGRILNDAPVILEVLRNGKKYGFVHADYLTNDWLDADELANRDSGRCMWDRDRIARAQHDDLYSKRFDQKAENNWHKPIANVDHVFFGHTPQPAILTRDNCTWLDTGAVFGWRHAQKNGLANIDPIHGFLSVVDLDSY